MITYHEFYWVIEGIDATFETFAEAQSFLNEE